MPERLLTFRERGRARGVPSLAEAVAATGGIAVAVGVLLISIDIRADQGGQAAEVGLFAALVVAGYLTVLTLPLETHPAGVTAIVLGIPGALGWAILPGAHSFDDIRPFLIFTIVGWGAAFALPRTRGRTIFLAAAALLLWLWILGEVAGVGAYSAAPLPSPPAHTLFSLQSYVGARHAVDLGDLDQSSPLYPLAQECELIGTDACDSLYSQAPTGSGFRQFAATCGNREPDNASAGGCAERSEPLPSFETVPSFGVTPGFSSQIPTISPIGPLAGGTSDKATEIGIVSALFGIAYLGALYVLDRGRMRGLATAFVVPGFVALLTGAQSLGNATHHAWAAGLLVALAGLFIGFVGDTTERRFTTWAGGFTVAYGAVIVALDASHISRALSNGNVKLAGPGLIVGSFGIGLVATGYVIAQLLRRPAVGGPAGGGPTFPTGPFGGAGGATIPPDPDVSAWAPPPTEPPSEAPTEASSDPAAAPEVPSPWAAPPANPGAPWPPRP